MNLVMVIVVLVNKFVLVDLIVLRLENLPVCRSVLKKTVTMKLATFRFAKIHVELTCSKKFLKPNSSNNKVTSSTSSS